VFSVNLPSSAFKPFLSRGATSLATRPDHPLTGRIGANLVDVLDRLGQTTETRERFRRALAILAAQVRAIGRAHPWHDEAERDYRAFLAAQGEAESAIDAKIAAPQASACRYLITVMTYLGTVPTKRGIIDPADPTAPPRSPPCTEILTTCSWQEPGAGHKRVSGESQVR
jgi:hypothetical protein